MYEAYSDYESMMNMAEDIVTCCALAVNGKLTIDYQVNCPRFHFPYFLLLCFSVLASKQEYFVR